MIHNRDNICMMYMFKYDRWKVQLKKKKIKMHEANKKVNQTTRLKSNSLFTAH